MSHCTMLAFFTETSPQAPEVTPTLQHPDTSQMVSDPAEKAEIFKKAFFPSPPEAEIGDIEDATYPDRRRPPRNTLYTPVHHSIGAPDDRVRGGTDTLSTHYGAPAQSAEGAIEENPGPWGRKWTDPMGMFAFPAFETGRGGFSIH
ncbi:hypothetical protein B0J13DRAFT_553077 [Dactylonectria estremocensis]|uniref:Uncharacterized protein n=1 Tax=Dactylonectria estremocensis TaxID=1079267 RepID=A0A9P9EXF4_9HYPO|nr:hypothetical protein B0J13DRAFT_553077 [Dactylonectria estremocensis]